MILYNLKGIPQSLCEGCGYVGDAIGFRLSPEGLPLEVLSGSSLKISAHGGRYAITYSIPAELWRALSVLTDRIRRGETEFDITEKRNFKSCGVMLDVSRNAVPKPETVKEILCRMACMGLNTAMLYTEDTYRIDGYPYFGYMRGAYTKEELKELDRYAASLGIELIPCIQTLGHLAAALRWEYAAPIRENASVLLSGEEETYRLIDAMLRACSECFSSKKIHIGMDEAYGVGLGAYLKKHGYTDASAVMEAHLSKVYALVQKYGKTPMIWSDMFFRLASKNDSYELGGDVSAELQNRIPDPLSLVFWNYYSTDYSFYDRMIKTHRKLNREVVFAGGIWLWKGMGAAYKKTFDTTEPALRACIDNGVENVFATVWGDDGAEVPIKTAYLGMQLYAEYNYCSEVSEEHLKERFMACCGYDAESFFAFDIDDFPMERCNGYPVTVSKEVLYQDILCGLFDRNFSHMDVRAHFEAKLQRLRDLPSMKDMEYIREFYECLLEALAEKSNIGIELQTAYRKEDRAALAEHLPRLDELGKKYLRLKELYFRNWYRDNKPFGFDVIDMRLGGVLMRIDTAKRRLRQYISREIEKIEELEEERLFYEAPNAGEERCLVSEQRYHRIATASVL